MPELVRLAQLKENDTVREYLAAMAPPCLAKLGERMKANVPDWPTKPENYIVGPIEQMAMSLLRIVKQKGIKFDIDVQEMVRRHAHMATQLTSADEFAPGSEVTRIRLTSGRLIELTPEEVVLLALIRFRPRSYFEIGMIPGGESMNAICIAVGEGMLDPEKVLDTLNHELVHAIHAYNYPAFFQRLAGAFEQDGTADEFNAAVMYLEGIALLYSCRLDFDIKIVSETGSNGSKANIPERSGFDGGIPGVILRDDKASGGEDMLNDPEERRYYIGASFAQQLAGFVGIENVFQLTAPNPPTSISELTDPIKYMERCGRVQLATQITV